MVVDPEFEPFTEDAIEARKLAPDLLMELAEIPFGSSELSEQERADDRGFGLDVGTALRLIQMVRQRRYAEGKV